jgi:hypothetical protein
MSEIDILIDWIHRVEYDTKKKAPKKRLDSLITEIYFEKTLVHQKTLGLPEHVVTGWIRNSKGDGNYEWLKIASKDSPQKNEVSKRFIKDMVATRPLDSFFLVTYEFSNDPEAGVPAVFYKLEKLEIISGKVTRGTEDENRGLQITNDIHTALLNLKELNLELRLKDLFSTQDENELKRLFAIRCLMNFSGIKGVDIDGMGINEQDQLVIIEFKRKYPTRGVRWRSRGVQSFKSYRAKIRTLEREYATAEKQLGDEECWETIIAPCFGLDTSHETTLSICIRNGWVYRYLIWNHSQVGADELFDEKILPKASPELLAMNVTGACPNFCVNGVSNHI